MHEMSRSNVSDCNLFLPTQKQLIDMEAYADYFFVLKCDSTVKGSRRIQFRILFNFKTITLTLSH
jgi:hypothetical protein